MSFVGRKFIDDDEKTEIIKNLVRHEICCGFTVFVNVPDEEESEKWIFNLGILNRFKNHRISVFFAGAGDRFGGFRLVVHVPIEFFAQSDWQTQARNELILAIAKDAKRCGLTPAQYRLAEGQKSLAPDWAR